MTDKKLQTLEEHERKRAAIFGALAEPRKNGIACPRCGAELCDDGPRLLSMPAKQSVRCPSCGHTDLRTA